MKTQVHGIAPENLDLVVDDLKSRGYDPVVYIDDLDSRYMMVVIEDYQINKRCSHVSHRN